jgi:hypothetical protein
MKRSNLAIKGMRMEAESAFSNYLGGRKEEFIGMEGRRSYMDGSIAANPEVEEIIIDIINTDHNNSLAAPLFGANEGFALPFDGVADILGTVAGAGLGISIEPQSYTLNELKEKSKNNPFTIMGIRYDFGDDVQLTKQWIKRYKDGMSITSTPYNPQTKRNLANSISSALDDPGYFQLIDAKAALFVVVAPALAAATLEAPVKPRRIQLMLRVGTQVDTANALKGQSVVVKNGVTGGIGY